MTRIAWRQPVALVSLIALAGCGGRPPTSPSESPSFLAGTWRTVTIRVNPGDPDAPPATSGGARWTFDVVPDTNRQTFRVTVRQSVARYHDDRHNSTCSPKHAAGDDQHAGAIRLSARLPRHVRQFWDRRDFTHRR